MKRTTRQLAVGLVVTVMGTLVWVGGAEAFWTWFKLKQCRADLQTCDADLAQCDTELAECEAETQTFPGDGYTDPSFGTSGHGPALSYTPDSGDPPTPTTTDDNTGYMWEVKLPEDDVGGNCADGDQANRSVHCVNNLYDWTNTLFSEFLSILNETCDGDESTSCTMDSQCTGIGNGLCGESIPFLVENRIRLDFHRITQPSI